MEFEEVASRFELVTKAYNESVSALNKGWLFATSLTVLSFTSVTGANDPSIELLGVPFTSPWFFLLLCSVQCLVNIHLVTLYNNCADAQVMAMRQMRDVRAHEIKVSDTVSLFDIFNRAIKSSFSRIYPILLPLPLSDGEKEKVMDWLKPLVDAAYLTIPTLGPVVSLYKAFGEIPFFGWVICLALLFPVGVSMTLSYFAVMYSRTRRKDVSTIATEIKSTAGERQSDDYNVGPQEVASGMNSSS